MVSRFHHHTDGTQVTTKITFVVVGSLVWGTALLTDMALDTPLHGATVVLQDSDQAALDLMARTRRKISEQALASFRFESATDLAAAVSGADVVVECIGIGGLKAMRADLVIPARYDVMQPVGANVVPGGINPGASAHPLHPDRLPNDGGGLPWCLVAHPVLPRHAVYADSRPGALPPGDRHLP